MGVTIPVRMFIDPAEVKAETARAMTLNEMAAQMRALAMANQRMRLAADKPVDFFRRQWGDLILILILNPTTWIFTVRRKNRQATRAQLAALQSAFAVPRNAHQTEQTRKIGDGLWLITKYTWPRRR